MNRLQQNREDKKIAQTEFVRETGESQRSGKSQKASPKTRRRSTGKYIKAFLSLIVICAVCLYAWVANLARMASSDLAFLKSKGIPTTVADYVKTIPHDGQNGSAAYETAMRATDGLIARNKTPPLQLTDSQLDAKYALGPTTTLWRRAAATDWCDFAAKNVRPPKGDSATARQREDLKTGIWLLIHSANLKAPYGPAFNEIYYASRISGNMSRGALGMAEEMDAIRADKSVMEGWQATLARGSNDPATITAAGRVLDHMTAVRSLDQMLRSEFVEDIWVLDNYAKVQRESRSRYIPSDFPTDAFSELKMAALNSSIAWGNRKRYSVKEWRDTFEHLPANSEDWKGYQDALNNARMKGKTPDWLMDVGSFLIMPDLIGTRTERLADRRIAKVALAVLSQRLQTGKLPSKLPSLGTDSIDPFTGKPFKFVTVVNKNPDSSGFKIYSIGRDLTDDGGLAQADQTSRGNYDVVHFYH